MAHYTTCEIFTTSNYREFPQCEIQPGAIIFDEQWTRLATTLITIARPLAVALIGAAIWNLWWLNKRWSMETSHHYGPNWVIATAMTHIPGLVMLFGSFLKIRKFGIGKVSLSLVFTLILVGIILPLLSLAWSSYVFKAGEVPYRLEKIVSIETKKLPESIQNRTPLLTYMDKVVFSEKPFLAFDLLKNRPVGMHSAEIKPVRNSWWRVEIHPQVNSCNVSVAELLDTRPTTKPSVKFGDDKFDVVQEDIVEKCSTLENVLRFLQLYEVIADSSLIQIDAIRKLQHESSLDRWCHLQYTCGLYAKTARGAVSSDQNGVLIWNNILPSSAQMSISKLMGEVKDSSLLQAPSMEQWLSTQFGWTNRAINLTKEAATFKYEMYASLGKYRPAHETLQQTLGEFTREATLQQAKKVTVIIKGQIKKNQFSWIMGLAWLCSILVSIVIILFAFFKSRNDDCLRSVLDSWLVVGNVAVISEETLSGNLSNEQKYYSWPLQFSGKPEKSPAIPWSPEKTED